MIFSFLKPKDASLPRKKFSLAVSRDSFVVGGVLSLVVIILLLISFDSYVFYDTLVKERVLVRAVNAPPAISSDDIDAIIKNLDARDAQFNQILVEGSMTK